ncbi:hypothetical protein QYE76_060226 [Lolium multiflorum]|uniref:Uncharacterized protein n=1 Tax=Lolium multiflorum TaxID=4521 RepID=A0AAD8W3L2_LOLMU|nr:hypothetical protein QYE76_060226 [Lolium multiflorum]
MASAALASPALHPPPCRHRTPRARPAFAAAAPVPRRLGAAARCRAVAAPTGPSAPGVAERPEADVVVIGSGLGGLCCAGLLAMYGLDVVVLESHDRPGGAAHSFDVKGLN